MLPDFHGCEKCIRRHLRMRMVLFWFMASEAPVCSWLDPLLWAWNKTEQPVWQKQDVTEEAVQLMLTREERRPGRGWEQSRAFLLWFNYITSPTSFVSYVFGPQMVLLRGEALEERSLRRGGGGGGRCPWGVLSLPIPCSVSKSAITFYHLLITPHHSVLSKCVGPRVMDQTLWNYLIK